MPKRQPQRFEVSLEFEGKTHTASYFVQSKVVTVESAYGSNATQVRGSPAHSFARILFREILQGAKSRGEL